MHVGTNKQQLFAEDKQASNQVHLTLNCNCQPFSFYVTKFARSYIAAIIIKLIKNNLFDTTQYTAASGRTIVVSLRYTKLNKNCQVSSEGKSLSLQDLRIYKTINESVIKLKLLLISLNVHPHPGPEFTNVICGTFNQLNNHKFGNVAGKQCCAIALYSLAFSTIKDVWYWQSATLDSILEH